MQNDLPGFSSRDLKVIVIEHETHLLSMAIDACDAATKGSFEFGQLGEKDISDHRSFQMPPQAFDEIEARTVRWQPEDADAVAVGRQPSVNCLGMVKASVVADQANHAPRVGQKQRRQERQEVGATLGVRNRMGDLARGIVHTTISDLFLVLARRGNFRLAADRRPHAGQAGQAVNFDFVLKNQDFRSIVFY